MAPMRPPAPLVQTARTLWHCAWLQLMNGLGPADREGRYRRPAAAFAELPPLPTDAGEPGSHVLIVGRSCPWAHRTWLTWTLRGLDRRIDLLVVEPDPQAGRWRFGEPFEGFETLQQLYRDSGAAATAPASVPALWSRRHRRILVNESARLIELLNAWPSEGAPDLDPPARRDGIRRWRKRLQDSVNDGVYRCGFARSQAAYDEAEAALFGTLRDLDAALAAAEREGEPWLCGPAPTLADVVLFPTLIRLELVYAPLFGCSRQPLWHLPALWGWRRRFYALEGVAATCWPQAWRTDYFGALFPLHPSGIVPAGPDLATLVGSPPPGPPPPASPP